MHLTAPVSHRPLLLCSECCVTSSIILLGRGSVSSGAQGGQAVPRPLRRPAAPAGINYMYLKIRSSDRESGVCAREAPARRESSRNQVNRNDHE